VTPKELLIDFIGRLPDELTLEEIRRLLYFYMRAPEGLHAFEAGLLRLNQPPLSAGAAESNASERANETPQWKPEGRQAPYRGYKPDLHEEEILAWAGHHRQVTGGWPTADSGEVLAAPGEDWRNVSQALRLGLRGLPGGSSLARLLALQRGVRNRKALPPFSIEEILAWADDHYARSGEWPGSHSGPVAAAPGETWMAVTIALAKGQRGLPGGTTLGKLLAEHRGVRNRKSLPTFTVEKILAWADRFHSEHRRWPTNESGLVPDSGGETWLAIDKALRNGTRGLPGGSSLWRLLRDKRGARRAEVRFPPLDIEWILRQADEFHERYGTWPRPDSGPIEGGNGETWSSISSALSAGTRGLPGKSSLARLLAERRGRRSRIALPPYSEAEIAEWARDHFRRFGRWPTRDSGPIVAAPGETWTAVAVALSHGNRGLPGGSTLPRLLAEWCGVQSRAASRLMPKQPDSTNPGTNTDAGPPP
jgi:hypothetical protein